MATSVPPRSVSVVCTIRVFCEHKIHADFSCIYSKSGNSSIVHYPFPFSTQVYTHWQPGVGGSQRGQLVLLH